MLNHIPKSAYTGKSVRVHFQVLKVLQSGFGSANYDPSKHKKGDARKPEDAMYGLSGAGGLFAKSYELISKGGKYIKGEASEKGGCILPGMVMESVVFEDQEKLNVFNQTFFDVVAPKDDGEETVYVPVEYKIFSFAIMTLASRSLKSKATAEGDLLQVKRLVPWSTPTVFGCRAMPTSMFATSVDDSVAKRIAFLNSDALTETHGFAIDQCFVQKMLSQTRHVVRLNLSAQDGDIGRNADGTLYIQLRSASRLVGVDISRVRLHDSSEHLSALGVGDWVENLLRFAMARKALQVIFCYDSMRNDMEDQIVDGFCMIDYGSLMSMCIQSEPLAVDEIPETVVEAAVPENGSMEDYDVYADDDDTSSAEYYTVISKKLSKAVTDEGEGSKFTWSPAICHPKAAGAWSEGRVVRIFDGARMVLFFVVSSSALPQGGIKRKFNELDEDGLDGLL
eukprot:3933273-Rhodomonas_salina.1